MSEVDIVGTPLEEADLGSYLAMRLAAPKPAGEERHARHIQRFYACRGLRRAGYGELFVLPAVAVGGRRYNPDVVGRGPGGVEFAYCAAESLAQVPVDEIRELTARDGPTVMVVAANVLDIDRLQDELRDPVDRHRVSIRTMTLPPFDDVLEYDIWMFELTFQEAVR